MANENLMDLALQLVQVEMELKILTSDLELADADRWLELHARLRALAERHETIADSLELLVGTSASNLPYNSDGNA